jgi:hypothetical protein
LVTRGSGGWPSRPALSALTPDYREISVAVIGGEATYGKLSFRQLMPTGKINVEAKPISASCAASMALPPMREAMSIELG